MDNLIKRTWAEINLDNIEHNYKIIRKKADKKAMMCCVIKADGYGHGAVQIARLYEKLGADWFCVSNIEEALELRQNHITRPILILGYTPVECSGILADNNISQACYSFEYAKLLSEKAVEQNVTVNIHLKLDTGMSRIGLMCQKFDRDDKSIDEAEKICRLTNLYPQGIFTHFAVSDEAEQGKDFTLNQFESYMHTVKELEKRGIKFDIRHCANSGAIIDYPQTHLDMVRAGIILYGLSPSAKLYGKLNLKPAMELKSVISQIKEIQKGTTISYGRTYTALETKKVATVPVGYADGFIRKIAEQGYININGNKAKILGRICMDQLIVDADNANKVKIGDIVTLFGIGENTPTADDIANWTGTINYEVVCLISKRVARVYFKDGKEVEVADHILK
ncbi:MAG: alanine racemase [Acutalibacteraceae bacterium]|nr:alanine racemase [Acutalibacteraceae bacterium]